ncbi:type VI secretion system protein TssA, partial [Corallococcus exiguus]|nr:type VI secretion system protein TssA [Corallococcus exiguus]
MSAPLLDLEKLLAPVSEDAPAGPHLRHDQTYDDIREARREDDPALLKDIGRDQFKHAHWRQVAWLCQEALPRSKDLQLAAWLTEALLELHGLQGLAEGLRLLAALADRYWDTAWPALEGGDVSPRVSVLEWLDRNATPRLKRIPLSQPTGGSGTACCYADWERILHREKHEARSRDDEPARDGSQPLDAQGFLSALRSTPAAFYPPLGKALREVDDAALEVESVFSPHLDEERPLLGQLRRALEDLRTVLAPVSDLMEPPAPSAPASPPDPSAPIP